MTRHTHDIDNIYQDIRQQLALHNTIVVTAPPGAGKSTILPLRFLADLRQGGKILMLEPRRLAARQIAERMSATIGQAVGTTVGYRVRFDNKTSDNTRIEVLTEGILTRRLVSDPTLDGVEMVIFDEFHERNLASDVALALTREAQQIIRPDLKIIIMSATIDTAYICQQLGAPLVEMHHRQYAIDLIHADLRITENSLPSEIALAVAQTVRTAHARHDGDLLAFLPGQAEILACQEMLADSLPHTDVYPLYGQLTGPEQQRAIAPSAEGRRKVVLATPIAETSLTIEGVRTVVDSGLYRKLVFNPQSGLSHLATQRISLDMATQRAGRAGRLADGTCYRLWSVATEHRMDPCRKAEIEDADLASTCLDVAAWGGGEISQLCWLTPPPAGHVAQAMKLLCDLGAVDKLTITPHGRALQQLPCHPRIAQMLTSVRGEAMKALAADVAALLEEKDPMPLEQDGADINTRIIALREMRRRGRLSRGWQHIARISEQYRSLVRVREDNDAPAPTHTGLLLALAYPERIAMASQGGPGRFCMASGDAAYVGLADDLTAYDWIAIGSVNALGGRVFLASPFDPSTLTDPQLVSTNSGIITWRDNISWDNKKGLLVMRHEQRIGMLTVSSQPIGQADKQQAVAVICEAARKHGTSMLCFDERVANLQQRVATVAEWHPELGLPSLAATDVLAHADEWLPLWLEGTDGKLRTTTQELRKIDLCVALWSLLSWEQQQQVDALAPTHIQVPTGSRISVEYRQGAALPVLRVRLQECFGMSATPRVDGGTRPVLMELLSPGFKPVQLTSDLRSFWENTYFEVRKELKRRYPKHSWPDNPLEAQAVRGVKRRQ